MFSSIFFSEKAKRKNKVGDQENRNHWKRKILNKLFFCQKQFLLSGAFELIVKWINDMFGRCLRKQKNFNFGRSLYLEALCRVESLSKVSNFNVQHKYAHHDICSGDGVISNTGITFDFSLSVGWKFYAIYGWDLKSSCAGKNSNESRLLFCWHHEHSQVNKQARKFSSGKKGKYFVLLFNVSHVEKCCRACDKISFSFCVPKERQEKAAKWTWLCQRALAELSCSFLFYLKA